ncbi:sulfurtransferase-like selenium metabolism protein YedF [uncultured Fretibacterium sp.]|uniref:sulfurtransferase-like selenium metabolism protein YedF n=1 Tax=uncultured Fretibacterium sp. TaxID=1678694 RepID=UPI0026364148|nr:sulfurtransferase-like selenium metabolism protein YedF [uncultured Fretibacterium sp.]
MITVNAVGKACPEPVIMTRAAVEKGAAELEVLVDNAVAVSNVTRFLEGQGFRVQHRENGGEFKLTARRDGAAASVGSAPAAGPAPCNRGGARLAVLVAGKTLGREDKELGEVLIKGFLGTLSKLETPPAVLALMNEGVKLALPDASTCDHLKDLERAGTKILVCGTCTNHFGVTERVGVGTVSNMFEILEAVTGADKVLSV